MERRLSRRSLIGGMAALATAVAARPAFAAVPSRPPGPIAFVNARVLGANSGDVQTGRTVVVEGDRIRSIRPEGGPSGDVARVVDCGGRTLMPGLIDAHWHTMMAAASLTELLTADVGYLNIVAAEEARRTLLRGFTTVRDMAGPCFGLKRAIDAGLIPGPRIYPSGAMISQTSGHGDFRLPGEVPAAPDAPLSRGEVLGGGIVADGADLVLRRAREQLMLGASQLKLAAGGGVTSNWDPIDVSQYTEAEFRAAVEAAQNWGTYVAVHAYTPRAIQTAIRGGVTCIEHGQLMDEETARIIADQDIWLSIQPFLDNAYANRPATSDGRAKQQRVFAGTDTAYGFAKRHGIKTAWGTDILFDPGMTANQGAILTTLTRWYGSAEIVAMATRTNAELLAMSGPRNPYPAKLGLIEAGAYADLLVVDGDPSVDIGLVADPEMNFRVIMKDGRMFKNSLSM